MKNFKQYYLESTDDKRLVISGDLGLSNTALSILPNNMRTTSIRIAGSGIKTYLGGTYNWQVFKKFKNDNRDVFK